MQYTFEIDRDDYFGYVTLDAGPEIDEDGRLVEVWADVHECTLFGDGDDYGPCLPVQIVDLSENDIRDLFGDSVYEHMLDREAGMMQEYLHEMRLRARGWQG